MRRFEGRGAVVTGGGSGIGFAVAERLASEGAQVLLWDHDETALRRAAERLGSAVRTAVLDVTKADDVERRAREAAQSLGAIDVLVASAGVTGPNAKTWEYPLDAWRSVIDVNLNGVFHCARAIVPVMLSRGYGRIVNVASIAGKEGNPNAPAYSASKAGVIGLTKSLGKELAGTGVTVNCVTPAAVRTPIFDQMTGEHVAYMLSKIPMGRFGTVDEVASLVCWLASEECSFSTGAVFDVSGGRATY
ncbi:MAG TPA: SDR family NAD(P)-dependent oxidoreductase [Candidatus Dormibacteraeota bacterium]|nr:SDR family NAD(P)-dependent oxidoreductase [Candidatus Dormibacteraeota bacterium]